MKKCLNTEKTLNQSAEPKQKKSFSAWLKERWRKFLVEESSKEASVDSSYFKAIEDSYLHRLEEIEKKLREVEKENKRLKKEKNKSFIERILSKKR